MTDAERDRHSRRPGRYRRAEPVTLTCLGPAPDPPFEAVTSASVVALTDAGLIVVADVPRGLDLPGGHVEPPDASIEATIRREAWEEARIRLGPLLPVEVIQSDYHGADDLTYMVIRASRVTELAPWAAEHESTGRVALPAEEFLARYRGGIPDIMRHLVTAGVAALGAS